MGGIWGGGGGSGEKMWNNSLFLVILLWQAQASEASPAVVSLYYFIGRTGLTGQHGNCSFGLRQTR